MKKFIALMVITGFLAVTAPCAFAENGGGAGQPWYNPPPVGTAPEVPVVAAPATNTAAAGATTGAAVGMSTGMMIGIGVAVVGAVALAASSSGGDGGITTPSHH